MIFNGRIWALIIKELLALFRDPRSRLVLIGPPLLQLFLFSYFCHIGGEKYFCGGL
ncbi:hypothetical protein [Gallibacterium anatis]|uniref:hypothetical protein n=1 Tax=Gallibacterium anatis TaxID=750 RepID=UPI000AC84898|nr:hypothetical protein [Gallibacterium anatis]